jgi:hypothetical protein
VVHHPTAKKIEFSGNLGYPGGLHHRRTALALREARGFLFIRIDAAELLAIRIIYADKVVVMLATAIIVEGSLTSS